MAAVLKCFVVADYKSSYVVSYAVVYYFAGSLVHVIIDLGVAVSCNRLLSVRRFFTIVLLILYGLQAGVFLVEPLIDGFEFSSVNDERPAIT